MKPLFAVIALGALAPMVQGVVGSFVPARFCPDLSFLLVIALGICWRTASGGLLLAALLGYMTDLLSGSLMGQHVLLRVLAFLVSRFASRSLNLRGPLPQAAFVAGLSVLNGLSLGALTAFFTSAAGGAWASPADLWPQALINAACAPFAVKFLEWLIARLGDEGGPRLLTLEPRNWTA